MRILFVAERYHPHPGGVETQTRLVVRELAESHDVAVAALTFSKQDVAHRFRMLQDSLLVSSHDSFSDEGVPVHALTPRAWERARMAPIAVRAVPRLQRYRYHELRSYGYKWFRQVYVPKLAAHMEGADVVHSVAGGYFGWAAREAARSQAIPFVCTPYVHPGQHGAGPCDIAHYCAADAVLALSATDHRLLVDLGVPAEKVHRYGVVPLLPESADPEGFRGRHGLGECPVVLFVGTMVDYKGYRELMEAAELVWATHPTAHVLFIGPGDEAVERQFEDADPRLQYLGFVSKQEKADALAACDVFCMPSRHEILPAVYLEAWSYGRPVIGGPAHGLEDLIEGCGGGLVTDQDPSAIASAIVRLLGDPTERQTMGARGRARVQEQYTVSALVSTLESVYAGLKAYRPCA